MAELEMEPEDDISGMRYYVTPSTLTRPRLLDTIDVIDLRDGTLIVLSFTSGTVEDLNLRMVDYKPVGESHPNLMEIILKHRRDARAWTRLELHDVMEWGVDTQTKADRYALLQKSYPDKQGWQQLATTLCTKVDAFLSTSNRLEKPTV